MRPDTWVILSVSAMVAALHWTAGFIVLAEAFNKLDRTDVRAPGLSPRERGVRIAKAIAWCLLAMGAGGALVRPVLIVAIGGDLQAGLVLITDRVSLSDLCVLGGFALLIVRSRFKEGITP